MDLRRSVVFEVLLAASASVAVGCGDDKPARDQVVFWMQLSEGSGQQCNAENQSYSLPDETARGAILGSGQGERLVDGDDGAIVTCSVSPGGADGQFDVSLDLTAGAVASFSVRGTVNKTPNVDGTGTFDTYLSTAFAFNQRGCTATVREALGGALWVSNLSCPDMRDPNTPATQCTGTGGFILENCAR